MADLPGSFEEALRALALWFESDEVPYTMVGGMAVSLLGQPRATQDIDVVVWLGERSWESFLSEGESRGFVRRIPDVLEFAAALETPEILVGLERLLGRRPKA